MAVELRALIERLNPTCRRALERAAAYCVTQTHYNVELEHLFLKLLEVDTSDVRVILRGYGLDPDAAIGELLRATQKFTRGNTRTPAMSPHVPRLLEAAWMQSTLQLRENTVRSASLILALAEDETLQTLVGSSSSVLASIPRDRLRADVQALVASSAEQGSATTSPVASSPAITPPPALAAGTASAGSASPSGTTAEVAPDDDTLTRYTTDLTALARAGQLAAVHGRDAEIRQVVDILLRRQQNNPLLAGEAGVGKTAIVEGLAARIARGDVPPALRHASVRALDLTLLQAGASVRGEFEQRLRRVIDAVKAHPTPIILFIDEAHTLVGAGGAAGSGDAANLLKPALARGELRTIAATTWVEYKRHFEPDPALVRRFQPVKVEEPDEAAAIAMLRGLVPRLETHHGVRILDEAVREAVVLAHRYLPGRRLPDSAVSVLDTAGARVALAQHAPPAALEDVLQRMASADAERMMLSREQLEPSRHAERLVALDRELATLTAQRGDMEVRWHEEREAVREWDTVRRRLDALAPDDADAEQLREVLQRVERGLEVIHGGDPLVPAQVDAAVVAAVVSGWTGVPVGRMLTDEIRTVLDLRDALAARVIGQTEALDTIARRIHTYRARLDDPEKPVGVFLLAGPSGVGKTETAIALADTLFGDARHIVTLNMSEYQEAHTVSQLRGAPPGYVGFGTGGILTEAVRRHPHTVLLLDEVEKAHPDVLELFFQVFDKGVLDDGMGVTVDFRNTIILLTSNVAADTIVRACRLVGTHPSVDTLVKLARPELLQAFPAAFLGRLVVVPYRPLRGEHLEQIVRLKLAKIQRRLVSSHGAELTLDRRVVEVIAERCTDADSGARTVDNFVTQTILPEIAARVLEHLARGDAVGGVRVRLVEHDALAYDVVSVNPAR